MDKVIVYLKSDYSQADDFCIESGKTKEEISEEVKKRYPTWFSHDIFRNECYKPAA